jgi:hypothetical protein
LARENASGRSAWGPSEDRFRYSEDALRLRAQMRFDGVRVAEFVARGWWRDDTLTHWLVRHAADHSVAPALVHGASAALAASDALRTLKPHFLVSNVDARDRRGLAELHAYRQVGEAVSAGVVLEILLPTSGTPPLRWRRSPKPFVARA